MQENTSPETIETSSPNKTTRNPLVAFLLTLITPGLGQIYNGQLRKGTIFFLLSYGILFSAGFSDVAHVIEGVVLLMVIELGLRLYMLIDAVVVALKKRHAKWESYNKWYYHLAIWAGMVGLAFVVPMSTILGVQSFNIPTPSQEPTLMVGDMMVADMRYYKNAQPQYGDLVVYIPNHEPENLYISRIIGLPGDKVAITDRVFYINGIPNEQTTIATNTIHATAFYGEDVPHYGHHPAPDSLELETVEEVLPNGVAITVQYVARTGYSTYMDEVTVPQGRYFVTSDNRDNALDSRYEGNSYQEPFGTIPLKNIKGKALYIIWAKDKGRIGKELK